MRLKLCLCLYAFLSFVSWMEQVYGSYLQKECKYITCDEPRQCRGDRTNAS